MNEHEESIDKSNDDAERRPRPAAPAGERGLSPPELLRTLVDGPPTEGDLQMLSRCRTARSSRYSSTGTSSACDQSKFSHQSATASQSPLALASSMSSRIVLDMGLTGASLALALYGRSYIPLPRFIMKIINIYQE